MKNLSEQTTKVLDDFYMGWFNHVNHLVIITTLEVLRPKLKLKDFRHKEFGRQLDEIAYAAEGLYDWDDSIADEIFCTIQEFCENLYSTPYSYTYQIPSYFYQLPIGNLVVMARLWASGILSSITIDYPAPADIHISLSQATLDYLINWDANLFWKVDAGQPYWACIPAYEGDFLLAKTQDFILDSSTNLLSFTRHIPSAKPIIQSKRKTKGNL